MVSKAHYLGADFVNMTMKKDRIRQNLEFLLDTEIHEDLTPLFSKRSVIQEHKGLVIV